MRSENPIDIKAEDEISVFGERGIWVNKDEVDKWRGSIDISEYPINEDHEPEVVTKKPSFMVEYVQELAIRYLRPATPPAPGEIIITQEPDISPAPAPPLIIRQQPERPETPEPLIIREAPPATPKPIETKQITIAGKRLPPPARKLIIERLAAPPAKEPNVIIERWLPYAETKRQVVFNKAPENSAAEKVKNVVINWEAPEVVVRKEVKYLGLVTADPREYREMYADSENYFASHDLPTVVHEVDTPDDIGQLASEHREQLHQLEGDLEGFVLVNLDAEGLAEYREQLLANGIRDLGAQSESSVVQLSVSVEEQSLSSAVQSNASVEEQSLSSEVQSNASVDEKSVSSAVKSNASVSQVLTEDNLSLE